MGRENIDYGVSRGRNITEPPPNVVKDRRDVYRNEGHGPIEEASAGGTNTITASPAPVL